MYTMKRILISLKIREGLVFLSLLFPFLSTAQQAVFQAGASTANITPPLGSGLVGNFGIPPPANYVHDELHARSLVLDDGTTKLVFVVVDNVGIIREVFDEAKRLIFAETKIPTAQILISSDHTHSASSASGLGNVRGGWNAGSPLAFLFGGLQMECA
jgi:neutral ceramidase